MFTCVAVEPEGDGWGGGGGGGGHCWEVCGELGGGLLLGGSDEMAKVGRTVGLENGTALSKVFDGFHISKGSAASPCLLHAALLVTVICFELVDNISDTNP